MALIEQTIKSTQKVIEAYLDYAKERSVTDQKGFDYQIVVEECTLEKHKIDQTYNAYKLNIEDTKAHRDQYFQLLDDARKRLEALKKLYFENLDDDSENINKLNNISEQLKNATDNYTQALIAFCGMSPPVNTQGKKPVLTPQLKD